MHVIESGLVDILMAQTLRSPTDREENKARHLRCSSPYILDRYSSQSTFLSRQIFRKGRNFEIAGLFTATEYSTVRLPSPKER